MQESLGNLDFEHLHQIFTLLGRSTDDYLYIYDLEQDQYTISETAIEQFALESTQFFNATEVLKGVCHPDDWPMLEENIQGIKIGHCRSIILSIAGWEKRDILSGLAAEARLY